MADEWPTPVAALKPMTDDGVAPITLRERKARLARAQDLMTQQGVDAVVVAAGSSLAYFTGVRWHLSERFFGMVLTRAGEPAWVAPAFEKEHALDQIRLGTDVRVWQEHESPSALIASILRDRRAMGRVGIEETMPYVFFDDIGKALPATRLQSATPVTAVCRMIKDAHEIALMRRACEITMAAVRAVFASLQEGMTAPQVAGYSREAQRRLGIQSPWSLVAFGAEAAFPHGATNPQPLRAGDFVLIDSGGSVHGYRSDITRTGVFGAPPTDRQRIVWDVVRQAQAAAFEAARPGAECQALDAAARKVVDDAGFGAEYNHFTHRLGHGIGLDVHEWPYLVRGNATKLQPGMCFTNEPGIYIPGEMGVRHEDDIYITEDGAESMVPWTTSPEEPAGP